MTTESEDLIRDLEDGGDWVTGSPAYAADVLLERGWTKPRTVTTAAELDALPVGSVVLSRIGTTLQRVWKDEPAGLNWFAAGAPLGNASGEILLPATVLHEGAK